MPLTRLPRGLFSVFCLTGRAFEHVPIPISQTRNVLGM